MERFGAQHHAVIKEQGTHFVFVHRRVVDQINFIPHYNQLKRNPQVKFILFGSTLRVKHREPLMEILVKGTYYIPFSPLHCR
jgi:hypothetical protein